jgi:transcriptional regulator GlxA family with amidase domain
VASLLEPVEGRPWVVGFLLLPDLILLSYASAVESLRAANQLTQRQLYSWKHISIDGLPVSSLTGAEITADARVGDDVRFDMIVVCSTSRVVRDETTFGWLRKLAREGTYIAGVAGGVYMLAHAGLLDGYRCAVHWNHQGSFAEEFPNLEIEQALYVIDRKRITCAGGGASADLMYAIIEDQHGRGLATAVNEWLSHGLRPQATPQRMSLRFRLNTSNPALHRAIAAMEADMENVCTREELALVSKVSVRQLERLFKLHLGTTIANYYRDVRLAHARQLLLHTSVSIGEISLAAGFSSLSYFSRAFKTRFGLSPIRLRDRS